MKHWETGVGVGQRFSHRPLPEELVETVKDFYERNR